MIIVLTTICLMAVFLCGYDLDKKNQMKVIKLDNSLKLNDEKKDITYNIDSIQLSNGVVKITGWALVNGIDSIDVKPDIILKDEKDNLYKIKTRIIQRKDITELMHNRKKDAATDNENAVYDNSGIISEFNVSDLNKNQEYIIGIQIQIRGKKYFVWTNNKVSL